MSKNTTKNYSQPASALNGLSLECRPKGLSFSFRLEGRHLGPHGSAPCAIPAGAVLSALACRQAIDRYLERSIAARSRRPVHIAKVRMTRVGTGIFDARSGSW